MNLEQTQPASLTALSLGEASELIRGGKVSPVELTTACLARIQQLDPKLNAFITLTPELALEQARQAEEDIRRGQWRGPIHGIPIALKDLIDTAGIPTTAASTVFKGRVPTQDAEVVRRLKAAGAVFLGKLNQQEFAYGGSSVVSCFGPVRNPWAPDRMAGGSSGGSAAAVAAEFCYAAIGTDTGGSIRQPAAYCGIVGLKPTYGRVSLEGVIPLSRSLDHIGPMTRTVRDAALMLDALVLASPEVASTNAELAGYAASLGEDTSSLRIGIPRSMFYDGLDPEIREAMEKALSVLSGLTSARREVEIPTDDAAIAITKAEAYAFHREYVTRNPELYQPETLRRISTGAEISAWAYIDALRAMEHLRNSIRKEFEAVDLLVTPTFPVAPFRISELLADIDNLRKKEVLALRNTRPFNLLGLPAISVPCGFTRDGLPIGMQITGPPDGEQAVLQLAHAYEQETAWHERRPNPA